MVTAPCAHVRLLGSEEALTSLLAEVLHERGIVLSVEGRAEKHRPDLVLVLVQRGDSILRLLERAGAAGPGAPVIVLLPYDDEHLARLALRSGAWGCFVLGRPLQELCSAICSALDATAGRGGHP